MAMMTVGETATLRWDWTMRDVDKLAKQVASSSRSIALSFTDAFEDAHFGIVEELYAAEERPTRNDLFIAGSSAVRQQFRESLQNHGIRPARDGQPAQVHDNFERYWGHQASHFPEDRILERMALPQVLAGLTGEQYEILAAVATLGSTDLAADAMGMARVTLQRKLKAARQAAIDAWYDHETYPTHDPATHCKFGHPRAKHSIAKANGDTCCRECQRQRQHRRVARGERKTDPLTHSWAEGVA